MAFGAVDTGSMKERLAFDQLGQGDDGDEKDDCEDEKVSPWGWWVAGGTTGSTEKSLWQFKARNTNLKIQTIEIKQGLTTLRVSESWSKIGEIIEAVAVLLATFVL